MGNTFATAHKQRKRRAAKHATGWAAVICIAMGALYGLSGNGLKYALFAFLAAVACLLMQRLLSTSISYGTWCLIVTAATVGLAVPRAIVQDEEGRVLAWMLVPMLLTLTMSSRRNGYWALVMSLIGLAAYFGPKQLGWLTATETLHVSPWQDAISSLSLFIVLYLAGRQSAEAFRDSRRQMNMANRELRREAILHEETQKRLIAANKEVIRTARTAGMAEVATGVLHNVGNALNTVVVMSGSVRDHLSDATMERRLDRLAGLIESDDADKDLLLRYVRAISRQAHSDRTQATEDMQRLRDAVDHVSTVVSAQQAHARCRGVIAAVHTSDLLEDVSKLASASLDRHGAVLCIDDAVDAMLTTERHQVVQILENVVRNAAESLGSHEGPRHIHMNTSLASGVLRIQVVDSGCGIPDGIRDTVFHHGFTTKQNGSGFGLHVSALAAQSIGGRLHLDPHVDGSGASFSLWIPMFDGAVLPTQDVGEVRQLSA